MSKDLRFLLRCLHFLHGPEFLEVAESNTHWASLFLYNGVLTFQLSGIWCGLLELEILYGLLESRIWIWIWILLESNIWYRLSYSSIWYVPLFSKEGFYLSNLPKKFRMIDTWLTWGSIVQYKLLVCLSFHSPLVSPHLILPLVCSPLPLYSPLLLPWTSPSPSWHF